MDFCSWVRAVFFDGEVNGGPVSVQCQETDSSVFFFLIIYLFIYFFIYGCAGSSFLCEGFL